MVRAYDHESILLPHLLLCNSRASLLISTAGRRLQLIPAAGPRDHMPLTMDLVTRWHATLPGPYARKMGSRESRRNALRSRCKAHFFSRNLRQNIRNSSIVGLAATEATPDDAWENLVQIIQETAGPCLPQGAPRPARPLVFGTKTSTTGTWYSTTSDRLLKRSESCGESKDRDHTSGETDASIFSLALEKTKGNAA